MHLDIAHASGILAQFGANPGKLHYEALKRVLYYLKGTVHLVSHLAVLTTKLI